MVEFSPTLVFRFETLLAFNLTVHEYAIYQER